MVRPLSQRLLSSLCEPACRVVFVLCAAVLGCNHDGDAGDGGLPTPREEAGEAVAFRNVGSGTAYVGDAACLSCHEDEYRGYQTHGMARSFYRLTDENRVEEPLAEPLYHAPSGLSYTVVAEGDGWYQEEFISLPGGVKTHRLRRRMDYVMGSGNAARTYFTESNGRLYELPLTWYTQRRRWDFSPGYDVANGRFDRLIPDRCMACHNQYPEPIPFVEGKYGAVPEGIGCERCHGPGELHVDERLSQPEPVGDVDDTIVNPAHLPFERRLDVCQQCHLQTTVSVLREGASPFSFEPSQALSDHVALFSAHEEASGGKIDVVSHADRMRRSACFLGTLGAAKPLECITCHNPHEGFRDQGTAYFNRTCLHCHDAQALRAEVAPAARDDHGAASNCIGCHMPRVEAGDAPHATFTDHWIRVVGRTAAEQPKARRPSELLEPYFDQDRRSRVGQSYLGMALIVYGRQAADPSVIATGAATLATGLGADTTRGEAHFLLGVAHLELGNAERAVPSLERAVRIDPGVPQRLEALAQAYEATRRAPDVIERLYTRALRIQPALAGVRVNYGLFLQRQGRRVEAMQAYREALDEQPWLDAAAFNLGTVLVELDRREEARRAFGDALGLNPRYAEALGNLLILRTATLPSLPLASMQEGRAPAFVAEAREWTPLTDPLIEQARAEEAVRIVPNMFEGASTEEIVRGGIVRFVNLPDRATVKIFTPGGTLVRTLEKPDAASLEWDATDDDGRPLASGMYLAHVRARDGDGTTLWTLIRRFAVIRLEGQDGT